MQYSVTYTKKMPSTKVLHNLLENIFFLRKCTMRECVSCRKKKTPRNGKYLTRFEKRLRQMNFKRLFRGDFGDGS